MEVEKWIYAVPLRLRSLLRRRRVDEELDEELRYHVERKTEENIARGMSAEEARRVALLDLRGVERAKEECRDTRGVGWVEDLVQDLRYGLRMLRKSPGFTTVAVLTLALGIGGNTAVFTVVNGVLLRPLPFPEPDRLFLVSLSPRFGPFQWEPAVSDGDYLAFRDQDRVFEHTATFTRGTTANLTDAGDPVQIPVSYVTADFFVTLRTNPVVGRGFLAGEEQPGRDQIAVISNELWRDRFDSDPHILGKAIRLDGVADRVVGIMPPGFAFPGVKVWMPLAVRIGHNSFLRPVVGRLRAGVSPRQAQAELETFVAGLPLGPGESKSDRWPRIIPLKDLLIGNVRPLLLVFAGAVAFVFLIACANVANLFLARSAGRGQEIAVRSALGARRGRLVRQLVTESTLLSVAGGMCGMLLAFRGVPALMAVAPARTVPRVEMIRIDGWVLGFTFGLSLLTGILFGLAPSFQATRQQTREALTSAGRSGTPGREGMRGALTISEVALAFILLTGAGLMMKSFVRLSRVNPGFSAHRVITLTVDLPDSTYRTAAQMQAFHTRTAAELSRLPGVLLAGLVNYLPLREELTRGDFQVEGGFRPKGFLVDKPCISPGYFAAMGIRLLRGRDFTERDTATAAGVVVVSQSVARTIWPGQDPLGKRISMEDHPGPGDWLTVVGVVDDVKQQDLAKKSDPAIYQSYLQISSPFFLNHMTFVVKTVAPPETVAAGMRAVLRDVDKHQPVSIALMDSLLAAATAEPRFRAGLLVTFALIALALTIVGVYGVVGYSVAERTREIGVRVALGAHPRDIVWMVIREGLVLAGLGIVIGVGGALALTQFLRNMLFEIQPTDPTTAGVAILLTIVALLACYLPARRAMRVDPMVALRHE